MPKVTQEYRDARREQILAAARRCFARDGFHATSMQDLFLESGLSSGAVYRYFASKDDVIIAIAEDNFQDVVELIDSLAKEDPDRSVGSVLANILAIIENKHAEAGLGGLAVLVWAEALRNPALAEQFTALLLRLRTGLAAVVREQPGRPAGRSPEALSALLASIIPGYILQLALLGPDSVAGVPAAARAQWPAS
jgi:AcrR family transcriptional regulator